MAIAERERAALTAALAREARDEAARLLADMMSGRPTASDAAFVVAQFESIAAHLPLTRTRIFILRSFTVEPIVPYLRARCYAAHIDADIGIGGFNTYAQELIDPSSAMYAFKPDVVVMAVRTEDVIPELGSGFADHPGVVVAAAVDRAIASYAQWFANFRERSRASLLVHALEQPALPASGVLDDQMTDGQQESIARLNRGIRAEAARHPGIYVVNYDALTARHGRLHWHDERRWRTLRMPLTADAIDALAREYMRFLHPLTGRVCKVLALDLDNTLWHGIVGEDGASAIRMDAEYPGSAYRAVQCAARDLKQRGIMLAVCSRNNPAEALDVLRSHPDMLLRPDDFAVIRVGWEDKDVMLREVARELNIGADAIAFFDDNPRERDLVRMRLPDAVVLDVPDDPMAYADSLRAAPVFERLAVVAEDAKRDQLVAGERQRAALRTKTASLEEFYRSLAMRVEVGRADQRTIPRIAQLTQKTNQFNLTTRRYSEAEIAAMAADPATRVFWMRLTDRFGDAGLVGVAILRVTNATADIDSFLLSCRVIGRTVETALLAATVAEARASGAARLTGSFVPTAKNAAARDFFQAHGFRMIQVEDPGTRWEYDLSGPSIEAPPWIACEMASVRTR